MGRPKKPDAMDEVLKIRVTKRLLDTIDTHRGTMSRSDWARGVLSTAAGRGHTQPGAVVGPIPTHRHVREVVEPAAGNRPAVVRCKSCHTPL